MFHSLVTFFAATCPDKSFFLIPPWYHYLEKKAGYVELKTYGSTTFCDVHVTFRDASGRLDLTALSLIGLGILDILLRLASLVAVGFIIYGGFQYLISQAEPDKTKRALNTIINAVIGLAITIVAAATVAFLGARIVT